MCVSCVHCTHSLRVFYVIFLVHLCFDCDREVRYAICHLWRHVSPWELLNFEVIQIPDLQIRDVLHVVLLSEAHGGWVRWWWEGSTQSFLQKELGRVAHILSWCLLLFWLLLSHLSFLGALWLTLQHRHCDFSGGQSPGANPTELTCEYQCWKGPQRQHGTMEWTQTYKARHWASS
jgi:hypothetical protein